MDNSDKKTRGYLQRINYNGGLDVTYKTLRDIHYAHIHAVPYENLDIMRKIPLALELESLYDKVVTRRRGGYCFELNYIFGWLLESIGFNVTTYAARFLRDAGTDMPKRRHRILRAEADGGSYICDVGVGSGVSRIPLKLEYGSVQEFDDESYRFITDARLGWIVQYLKRGEWENVYCFTEDPQYPVDFVAINYFCQYAPESPFNKENMAALRTKEGRNTIAGDELRLFRGGGVTAFKINSEAELNKYLLEYFGIVL